MSQRGRSRFRRATSASVSVALTPHRGRSGVGGGLRWDGGRLKVCAACDEAVRGPVVRPARDGTRDPDERDQRKRRSGHRSPRRQRRALARRACLDGRGRTLPGGGAWHFSNPGRVARAECDSPRRLRLCVWLRRIVRSGGVDAVPALGLAADAGDHRRSCQLHHGSRVARGDLGHHCRRDDRTYRTRRRLPVLRPWAHRVPALSAARTRIRPPSPV